MSHPPPGRVAGIDYGTVRIGIALSDPGRTLASPWETYTRKRLDQDAEHFRQLVRAEEVTLFVVGLPVHTDGRESQKSVEARRFGRWLEETTRVTVEFFDERFTTVEAEQHLREAELSRRRRQARRDKLAAQILLAAYLESNRDAPREPGPLDDRP